MSHLIPLTKGCSALVDDADFLWLTRWRWRCNNKGYAMRSYYVDGKEICVYMHRLILQAPVGYMVDHIDHDRLNNRRENLRLVTPQQNLMNRRRFKNNTSGFKGVTPLRDQWQARIQLDGESIHLGLFPTAEAAARAYDAAARVLFREYALLNFPDPLAPHVLEATVAERLSSRG